MVVKCHKCDKYFNHTEQDTKCPFCHTEYSQDEEKTKKKPKERKVVVKTQKESFKIWKNN